MADWLTPAAVAQYGGAGVLPTDPQLVATVAAVRTYLERRRPELASAGGPEDVEADIQLGACMLAWRWFQRRSSPLGTAGYPEFGSGGMLRHDPDIARLLQLGADAPFAFGAGGRRPATDPDYLDAEGPALAVPPARGWLIG